MIQLTRSNVLEMINHDRRINRNQIHVTQFICTRNIIDLLVIVPVSMHHAWSRTDLYEQILRNYFAMTLICKGSF